MIALLGALALSISGRAEANWMDTISPGDLPPGVQSVVWSDGATLSASQAVTLGRWTVRFVGRQPTAKFASLQGGNHE